MDSLLNQDMALSRMSFLGQYLLSSREYDSSIKILESAKEKYPNNPELLGALISAYDFSGKSNKAISELEKWVETNPNDRTAQSMLESLRKRSEKE